MARTLRECSERDVIETGMAIELLRNARNRLREAGASEAAKYVGRAIKSAEGALNHAKRCQAFWGTRAA